MANGTGKFDFADIIVTSIKQLGIPTAFLIAIVYIVGWQLGPKIVDGHLELLKATTVMNQANTETLKSMYKTQKELSNSINKLNFSVNEIVEVERRTNVFMNSVIFEHSKQTNILNKILKNIN